IVSAYRNFLDNVLPTLQKPTEKAYIQILFDYDFLVKIIDGCWVYDGDQTAAEAVVKETKVPVLAVLALIRSLIDPIDLAIAASHHAANVDRYYSRTSVLLGTLLALNPKPSEIKKNPSLQEMHNVIAVASQPPRFTMLLTSLPGASLPAASRSRGSLTSLPGSQSELYRSSITNAATSPTTKQRKPRAKIMISANSNVNSVGKENANNTSYSISGSVLSGVVGLVGAAANTAQMAGVSQSSLFGGAQSMFGALMGGGGATSTTSKGTGGVSSSGNSPKKP
ncbi:hypothetical protein HDU99_005259, partial [Rhizoclosmatium hyalinum]